MTEDLVDIVLENDFHYVKKNNINPFFDLKYLEAFLKRQKLEFLSIKDSILENSRIPTMAQCFYEAIVYYGRVPTQTGFANYYFKKFCTDTKKGNFVFKKSTIGGHKVSEREFYKQALKSRLNRTYPSLIRDFHFFLLCRQSNLFDSVRFSLKEDFGTGCDLTVSLKKKEAKARLFVDTKRSRGFLAKKHRVHEFDGIFVDIPLNMRSAREVGMFKVFDDSHVQKLLDAVRGK